MAGFEFTHWPVDSRSINQAFGANPEIYGQYGLPGHEGIDHYAPFGAAVYAVAPGTVYRVGDDRLPASEGGHNYGVRIYIRHTDGYRTSYAHLDRRVVNVGDVVAGGQIVGYADSTGNVWPRPTPSNPTAGSHLHLTLYNDNAYPGDPLYIGYPYGIVDPTPFLNAIGGTTPPPPTGTPAAVGLHASADPGDLQPVEFAEFQTLRPRVIKVLSGHSQNAINKLYADQVAIGNANNVTWLVRAFLKFIIEDTGEIREISPQQFYNDTVNDVMRAINTLTGHGVPTNRIIVEIPNEPNLMAEGAGRNWNNGIAFSSWYGAVLAQYRLTVPAGVKLAYPGLSPGGAVAGVRYDAVQFLAESAAAIANSDVLCCHAYWSQGWPRSTAVQWVQHNKSYNKPVYVSECSINDNPAILTPAQYAADYVQFLREIGNYAVGVAFYVASASNSVFWPESWIVHNSSKGIAAEVRRLLDGG